MCNFILPTNNQCKNAPHKDQCHIKSHQVSQQNTKKIKIEYDNQSCDIVKSCEVMSPNNQPTERPIVEIINTVQHEDSILNEIKSSDDIKINSIYDSEIESDDEYVAPQRVYGIPRIQKRTILDDIMAKEEAEAFKCESDDDTLNSDDEEEFERQKQADEYALEELEEIETTSTDLPKVDKIQQCIERKDYDESLYELCTMITPSWFNKGDNLIWNLAGMLNRMPHSDYDLMGRTYVCILKTLYGDRFSDKTCLKDFKSWDNSKYQPTINMTKLKNVAGGCNHEAFKVWKAKYDIKKSNGDEEKRKTPVKLLKEKMMEIVEFQYKREYGTGAIYEKKIPFYYARQYEDTNLFLNDIFGDEPLWLDVLDNQRKEIISSIKNVANPAFPFIKLDYNYIGFKNGMYDLATATFTKTDDITINVQVRKYIDIDFIDNDHAPLLDAYLRFQFESDEDLDMVYFAIGRSMGRITDRFDFMTFLYGEGGSGKSLLMNLAKYSYNSEQVAYLSSTQQDKFGMAEFAVKEALFCDDTDNLAKTLEKANFLSMTARGSLNCPIKHTQQSIQVHDWDMPMMLCSNRFLNYSDKANEVTRRVLTIYFAKAIKMGTENTQLEEQIKTSEFGVFLHRCRSTYLKFCKKYAGQTVESFETQTFADNRDLLRMASNNTYHFISTQCYYKEGAKITTTQLSKALKQYVKNRFEMTTAPREGVNVQSILRVDKRYTYEKSNICKDCRKQHKVGCCLKHARLNYTKTELIHNLVLDYSPQQD